MLLLTSVLACCILIIVVHYSLNTYIHKKMSTNLLAILFVLHYVFSVNINGDITSAFVKFTAHTSPNNAALCAFQVNPISSLFNVCLIQCISACRRMTQSSTCTGINHFDNGVCLMYSTMPIAYTIQSGCIYYSVRVV